MSEGVDALLSPIYPKPCYLLADSRLLFEKRSDGARFLDDVVMNANSKRPSIAYIGASNGDNRTFYHDIFLPACEPFELGERRLILSRPSADDTLFLSQADIILMAGGSVEKGWNVFSGNGFRPLITQRYRSGALLLGISAGAVQLGCGGLTEDESAVVSTFGFVGLYVGVHEEHEDWKSLRLALSRQNRPVHGIGIPSGGGVMFYSGDLYPIRKPLFEIEIGIIGRREGKIYPHRFKSQTHKLGDNSAMNLN